MNDAANYLKGGINVAITNVPISVDGTWQKRGFSSLNGVATAILLTVERYWIEK